MAIQIVANCELNNNIMNNIITVTKEELVKAMHNYNLDTLNNPDNYGEIEGDEDCAIIQVENLIKHLPESHLRETDVSIKTNVVSEFISFAKDNGVNITNELFDFFFDA